MTTMRGTLGIGPSPAPAYRQSHDWRDDAACDGADLALFFEHGFEDVAIAYCNICPVRQACLDDILDEAVHGARPGLAEHGVIGGTTEAQRLPLIRAARKAAREAGVGRRKPVPCGTEAGYRAHRRREQDPCRACREAMATYQRERRSSGKRERVAS